MRHSDVVFMYVPKTPDLYDAYGCSVVLWGGGAENAKVAKEHGVHFQSSIWFLTAWGDKLAADPELLRAVCVDIEGKPIEVPWLTDHKRDLPNYWGCTNAPYYQEYILKQAREATQGEFAGLHIDDHCGTFACASYAGGCFCEHCMAGFREWLKGHYTAAELAGLGVADVDRFSYADSVREVAKTKGEYQGKRTSLPLYMPFMSYQAEAEAAMVGRVRAEVEKTLGPGLSLSANCGLPSPLHLADYMHLDTLCGEIGLDAGAGKPSDSGHFAYKVADGVKRPLASTGSGWDWAWVAERNKPGLVKTWVAESYAFGNRLMAPHHQWCYTAEKGTHWWDGATEDFAPLYRTIATHRELFDGFETASNIVLVYNTPAAYRGKDRSAQVGAYLATRNLQYRVEVAGGDWVPERLTAEDLAGAEAVMVTSRDDLDEAQRAVLDEVERAGRLIEWTGPGSCEGKLPGGVVVEGAEGVWATVRANAQTGEVAVHLLNRNYDLGTDGVVKTGGLRVAVPTGLVGGRGLSSATAHAMPGGEGVATRVTQEAGGTVVEVPELGLWSVVLLR